MTTPTAKQTKVVRCAIYTRKSTSEGLDRDFNTLDAQREAAEHYIRSQAQLGWTAVPTKYDDGGFTGGNLDRPALQQLLDDIDEGKVDVVVVYKVDRLSRSLLDFARVMERFDKKNVGFVSITQHFDTSTSMGRLVLNVLLSFAQFERELISERTRDKIAAARRRGKWTGGPVVLGYRIDKDRRALVVAQEEVEVVRLTFELYLRTRSIGAVAQRLNALGHTQKRIVTRAGREIGGKAWDKNAVHRVLTNPIYIGKIRQKSELHAGEHEAIVSREVFDEAQTSLKERSTGRRAHQSRKFEYLLTGLLRCVPCGAAMTSSMGMGRGGKRYRYYRCRKEQNEGSPCPTGLIAADEIEAAVISRVRAVAENGEIQKSIVDDLKQRDAGLAAVNAQRNRLEERLEELTGEARRLLAAFGNADGGGKLLVGRLGELEAEMDRVRTALGDVESQLRGAAGVRQEAERVAELLEAFDKVWDALVPEERRDLLHLIVRKVSLDAGSRDVRIAFTDVEDTSAVNDEVAA